MVKHLLRGDLDAGELPQRAGDVARVISADRLDAVLMNLAVGIVEGDEIAVLSRAALLSLQASPALRALTTTERPRSAISLTVTAISSAADAMAPVS